MSISNSYFRIITYHRVCPPQNSLVLDPGMISATPEGFARQMQYLANHYNVIGIQDILNTLTNGTSLPQRAVLITFDDGYYDFLEYAWPILQRLELPAVIFVATEYASNPDKLFWWDRIANAILNTKKNKLDVAPLHIEIPSNQNGKRAVIKKVQSYLKTLSNNKSNVLVEEICQSLGEEKSKINVSLDWEQLRKLNKNGIIIGAHSQSHPLLTQIPIANAQSEILGSQNRLKLELEESYPIFCYPNGSYNNAIIQILKNNGFSLAFTTHDGHNNLHTSNPYCLCRTNITLKTSLPIFKFRITRTGAYFDKWRHRHK